MLTLILRLIYRIMDGKLSIKEVLMVKRLIQTWNKTNLMKRIALGIFVGALLAS